MAALSIAAGVAGWLLAHWFELVVVTLLWRIVASALYLKRRFQWRSRIRTTRRSSHIDGAPGNRLLTSDGAQFHFFSFPTLTASPS